MDVSHSAQVHDERIVMSDERIGPTGCWLGANEPHAFDLALCQTLSDLFKIEQVVDVLDLGCGDGAYGRQLRYDAEYKMPVLEIDGNPHVNKMTNGHGICRDLSKPLDIILGTFDCVMSLEVGEHIPREFEQTFLDNVCRYAGNLIVLSWAIEGQAGFGHVNCRNNDYIIMEMQSRGFVHDDATSMRLREAAQIPWFKNTVMVFRKNILWSSKQSSDAQRATSR